MNARKSENTPPHRHCELQGAKQEAIHNRQRSHYDCSKAIPVRKRIIDCFHVFQLATLFLLVIIYNS
ncbi:MAG: hypothetical protein LBE13_11905 [Bacteroidales bacterium]|nr:hypothetical protein [Bacteroidales bacterium]